jgi:hypothetical protein
MGASGVAGDVVICWNNSAHCLCSSAERREGPNISDKSDGGAGFDFFGFLACFCLFGLRVFELTGGDAIIGSAGAIHGFAIG